MAKAATKALPRTPSDRVVMWAVFMLSAIGVVAVYSAVGFLAETKAGGDTERFLFRHVLRVGLALGVAGALSLLDYRRLAKISKLALALSIGLLIAVQVMGVVTNGAQRWIEIGPISFQPSDFAKVALILHVAVLLARKQDYIDDLGRGLVPLLVWIVPTILLIGMEDLSTAAVVALTVGVMLFVGRVRVLHLGALALVGAVLASGFLASSPQRAARPTWAPPSSPTPRTHRYSTPRMRATRRIRRGSRLRWAGWWVWALARASSATSSRRPTTTSSSPSSPRSTD